MSELVDIAPCMDWLNGLEPDMSVKVLTCLDDVKDLVQVSTVSRTWRRIGKLKDYNTSSSIVLACVIVLFM